MDVGADLVCVLGRDPIPLPDASVDRANASYLLDHLWHQCQPECAPPISWDMFWRDLHRVLKPGGYLTFVASLSSAPHNWRNCEALADLPGEWRLIPVASESYARGTVVAVPVAR